MKLLVFSISAILLLAFSGITSNAQQLERKNEGKKYSVTSTIFSLDEDEVESWEYSESKREWSSKSGFGSVGYCNLSNTILFSSISVRHTRVDGIEDSISVLEIAQLTGSYKYASIKKGWRSYTVHHHVAINGDEQASEALKHIQETVDAEDSTYSSGARLFKFETLASGREVISKPDDTDFDNMLREIDDNKSSVLGRTKIGIAIFPVKIDGISRVRFILYLAQFSPMDFDKKCFDEGYMETSVEEFSNLLAAIQ